MEDSKPTVSNPTDPLPPTQHWAMARAIASAAFFGFIGQLIGGRLGRKLDNKMVEPTLRWSMGSFWALIAAYSSLKASAMERGETVKESPLAVEVVVAKIPETTIAIKTKTPLPLIDVHTLKDHEKLQALPQLQLAGK